MEGRDTIYSASEDAKLPHVAKGLPQHVAEAAPERRWLLHLGQIRSHWHLWLHWLHLRVLLLLHRNALSKHLLSIGHWLDLRVLLLHLLGGLLLTCLLLSLLLD